VRELPLAAITDETGLLSHLGDRGRVQRIESTRAHESRTRLWVGRALLLVVAGLSPWVSDAVRRSSGDASSSIWSLQDSRQLVVWLEGLAFLALFECVRFIPTGFLAVRSIRRFRTVPPVLETSVAESESPELDPTSGNGGAARAVAAGPDDLRRSAWGWIAARLLAVAIAIAIKAVELAPHRLPSLAGLMLPLSGCFLGAWLGSHRLSTWSVRFQVAAKFVALVFAVAVALAGVCLLAIEREPLPFEPGTVTSEDKRELVELFRASDPRDIEAGQSQRLVLSSAQLNRLVTWGLSIGSDGRKATVELGDPSVESACSIRLPLSDQESRYLNVRASGQLQYERGHFRVLRPRVAVGRIGVPSILVNVFVRGAIAAIENDRTAKPMLDAVQRVEVERDQLTITFGRMILPPGRISEAFNKMKPGNDVLPMTQAYVQRLLEISGQLPEGDAAFGVCVEEAFRMAAERSRDADPARENRACIYALATLLGHWRIQTFVGRVLPLDVSLESIRPFSNVSVRGRTDWTKHFWVSAALALLTNQASSDAVGILKEELDAGTGGSGFSFGDLLADRSGTTFGLVATRDRASAQAMQHRLARGFVVDELIPFAADLPEDLTDAQLTERFGGVNGEGYNRIIREIETRVAACAAYK
jgi:hypothetical protein